MNPKTTIVLLVLTAAGVVGFLLLGPGGETPESTTAPVFPGFASEDVSEIAWGIGPTEVRVRRGESGFEVEIGDGWDTVQSGKIEEVLSDLTSMSRRMRIDGSEVDAQDRRDYQIDPALGWISFTLRGEEQKLLFGRASMRRDTVYAQRPDESDVLVVDDDVWTTILPLTANELRERRVVPWVEGDVDRITVKAGGEVKISGERVEKVFWRATAPYRDYLHPDRFGSRLFHLVSSLEAETFIEGTPTAEELAGYGLDEPRWMVELHRFRGADETVQLKIGADVEGREGFVYFQRADRPFVSVGQARSLVEILGREAEWFRDPSVTHLQFTPVAAIESTWDGDSWRAELDHDEWHLVEPEARLLDASAVGAWIDSLRDADAEGYVNDPDLDALGLAEPAGRLVLRPAKPASGAHGHEGDEGAGEESAAPPEPILELSFSGPGEDGKRTVIRAGNEATAYVIGPELAGKFEGGFWRFLPPAVFPDAPADAEVVALRRVHGEEDLRLVKEDGKWPEGVKAAPLNAVVSRLLGLFAARWVGPAEGRVEELGLGETPFAEVEVTFRSAEDERKLGVRIGAEVEGGRYALVLFDGEAGPGVFVVTPDDVDRLTVPLSE